MADTGKKRTAKAQPGTRPGARPGARRGSGFGKFDKALETALNDYFKLLDGHKPERLHKLVFDRVEKKLLEHVLKFTEFHQSRAAALLGISRSTLRSKIRAYGIKTSKTRAPKKR